MDFNTWKAVIAPYDLIVKADYETFKKKSTVKRAKDAEMNTLKDFYNEWKENNYKIKPEIQIAMTVLGRIRTEKNKPYWVDLPPINLFKVKLANANLLGANLQGADLWGAQNYTIEQLLEARTLYDIKGLSNEDKEAIRAKKRQLLDDPSVFEVKVHK